MGKHEFCESTDDTSTELCVFRVCALKAVTLSQNKPIKAHL